MAITTVSISSDPATGRVQRLTRLEVSLSLERRAAWLPWGTSCSSQGSTVRTGPALLMAARSWADRCTQDRGAAWGSQKCLSQMTGSVTRDEQLEHNSSSFSGGSPSLTLHP